MNNLYIINEVLYDYTPGMAVICAPCIGKARDLFLEDFEWNMIEYDLAIERGKYTTIAGVDYPEGVVSYVYGGG